MSSKLLGMLVFILGFSVLHAGEQEPARPKFTVKITDEKPIVVDVDSGGGPVDPQQQIRFQSQGNFNLGITTMQNQPLHLSHFPNFLLNGRFLAPGQGGRFENVNTPLPKTSTGKARIGTTTTWLVENNLRIMQTVELVASKAKKSGEKRQMDTVQIGYSIENKSPQAVKIGMRVYMDTYVIDNDGCMFAAPTMPNKILDGMVLQEKTFPSYLQMLQRPNLQNPGFVTYLSLNMGSRFEKPKKLVMTRHGAGFGTWDMPAFASMGDSAVGVYWDVKDLKPGGKRDLAYAYGAGIAVAPDSEGRFQVVLGGSFEPGKMFTVSAAVADPGIGQSLALELPAGMERIDGKEIQPVAPLIDGQETSTVLWKARVVRPGNYTLRLRSSTGVTQTKLISITPAS